MGEAAPRAEHLDRWDVAAGVVQSAGVEPVDEWSRLLQSAGVCHVRLHDGRHTAATLLLSENVHPRVVMELLGHSQMRTTMDIYSHIMPALAREAADRMRTPPAAR